VRRPEDAGPPGSGPFPEATPRSCSRWHRAIDSGGAWLGEPQFQQAVECIKLGDDGITTGVAQQGVLLFQKENRGTRDVHDAIAVRVQRLRVDAGGVELFQPGGHPFAAYDRDRHLTVGKTGTGGEVQLLDVLCHPVFEGKGKGLGNAAGALHGHVGAGAQDANGGHEDDRAAAGTEGRSTGQRSCGGRHDAGSRGIHDGPLGETGVLQGRRVIGREPDYQGLTHHSCCHPSVGLKGPQPGADLLVLAFQQTVHSGLHGANRRGHR
jgi:hypothetical protein